MPLFKSLRSKASSRKSVSSVKTNKDEKNTDFGPHPTSSSTTYGSVRSTKAAAVTKADTSSPSKHSSPPPPPSLPRYTSSSSVTQANGSATTDAGMMRSLSGVSPSLHSRGEGSIENGPRPSELFAGKGVQWGAVKLAGPNVTPTPISASNTTEDMQNFLKMRRQWKPTFATEDDSEKLNKGFQPPNDLSQLSFASGDKVQGQGLMSLKELEESHKRKEKLLSAAPLGGSLWDEAETSKAASARMAKDTLKAPKEATKYGKKPSMFRQASNQSASSIKSAKKLFGGHKEKTSVPPAAVPVPPRDSSSKVPTASDHSHLEVASGTGGGALGMTGMAPPIAAADLMRAPDEAIIAEKPEKEAPVLAQEEAITTAAPTQEVESTATASEIPNEAAEKDAAGLSEAQQTLPGAFTNNNETIDTVSSEPVAEARTNEQAEAVLVDDTNKQIEPVAVDDADKTLTTNDVQKMAVEGEKKEEEVGAVSAIPQEASTTEAIHDEPLIKLEPVAQAATVEVTPQAPSLT